MKKFSVLVKFEILCNDLEELTDITDNLVDHVLDTFGKPPEKISVFFKIL